MKKSLFLVGLAILTFSVSGMNFPNPNDQGNSNEGNEDDRRVRARTNVPNHAPGDDDLIAWYNAVRSNDLGEMKRLSKVLDICYPAPSDDDLIAWFNAVRLDDLGEMKRLSKVLDIRSEDRDGNTALHIASFNGNLEIVRWILDYSVEPLGIVQLLSANKNHIRLRNEDIEVLRNQSFPDRLELVSFKNNRGKTPLCVAAENGHLGIVQYLVEHGADVNEADYCKVTPLCVAAENGHLGIVQYLVEQRADVNKADDYGATPLFEAAENGHLGIVQYLVEHGVDINKATNIAGFYEDEDDYDGVTPLCIADNCGHLDIVQYLKEHGAN